MMTLFRRRKNKFVINEPDPVHNVIYLGNVVTVMAKGDNCYEKALNLIWKTYTSRTRPDLPMELTVTCSGLKAMTKQQGLTEYWSNRITFCAAPKNYPKVFVWIYKHEGKRMKPELRCHAVLCKRSTDPTSMSGLLQDKISSALQEYKREKILRQNLRLSASNNLGIQQTLPLRKTMLKSGKSNFKAPMERSKSAPKLALIEEESLQDLSDDEDFDTDIEADRLSKVETLPPTPSPSEAHLSRHFGLPVTGCSLEEEEEYYSISGCSTIDTGSSEGQPSPISNDSHHYSAPHFHEESSDFYSHDAKLKNLRLVDGSNADIDNVSDESGFNEEKSSLEGYDAATLTESDSALNISIQL